MADQLSNFSISLLSIFLLMSIVDGRPFVMIDLSYAYDANTPTYPMHVPFESRNRRTASVGEVQFQTAEFYGSEHSGTHMDAPYHFLKEKKTMDQLPLEIFEGPGVVLDITHKADLYTNPDAVVTMEDITEWEKKHGRIPEGSIILMNSGWGKYAHNKTLYSGMTGGANDSQIQLHFPGFHEEACKFLTESRNVRAFGADTLSLDVGKTATFPCHYIISNLDGIILENVANVDQLPPTGSYIKAYPMKIAGGSGAPTRVIATVANPYAFPK